MASMTYFHNADEEMLYALPPEPEFESKINRYGESKGWIVSVTVQISTPNNVYKRGRWLIPFEVTHRHRITSYNVCYTKLLRTGRTVVLSHPKGPGPEVHPLSSNPSSAQPEPGYPAVL